MAIWMTLTLEPIKSLCTISTMWLVFLLDGLTQSLSEAVPFNLQEGPGVQYSLDRQAVALWEDVFLEKPLPFDCSVRWAFLLGLSWCFEPSL